MLSGIGLGGEGGGAASNGTDTAGNVMSTVKGWLNVAGTKMAETEEQIWKRINGQ